jgi:hypothetical protein
MTRKPKAKARTTAAKPKPRPHKPALGKRARAKPAQVSKPTRAQSRDPLDQFIDVAARTLGLPVEEAWRPAIAANLRATFEHAAAVEAFALPDDAEPGPVFKA